MSVNMMTASRRCPGGSSGERVFCGGGGVAGFPGWRAGAPPAPRRNSLRPAPQLVWPFGNRHLAIGHLPSSITIYLPSSMIQPSHRTLKVTLNGTGFAAVYTARTYGLIPHRNGVAIELAGGTSGTR